MKINDIETSRLLLRGFWNVCPLQLCMVMK